MMNIGGNIKRLRQQNNMTQDQVAEKLHVSYQAVSKWENNINAPDITLLPKIANLFGVSIDMLFSAQTTDEAEGCFRVKDGGVNRTAQIKERN